MKIAIVSGGTGGHIYPGIAIADELKSKLPSAEILFLGGNEGLESDLVPKAGYRIRLIRSRALLRKLSYKAVSAPFVTLIGFLQALFILKRFSPQALVSTGGYASLPVVLAARLTGIPIFLQEQNLLPGFTNRLCARWARAVFLSFEQTRQYLDGSVTGNPVRREILAADREQARRRLGCGADERVVLIMGGSQGARSINLAIVAALPAVQRLRNVRLIHVVGRRDSELMDEALSGRQFPFYNKVDYLYNMGEALAAADLAVSRAGATAIAEFSARGLPMALIPFPYSAEGHQDINALAVTDAGAGVLINNDDFTADKFVSLVSDGGLDLKGMGLASRKIGHPEAAARIVDRLIAMSGE